MRIAQVAPLAEAVPPRLYGGTERIVSWLTEELVAGGHEVTLFASGDSCTAADLAPCVSQGLRLSGIRDHTANLLAMLDNVLRREDEFDIIHFHVDLLQFATFKHLSHKCLTTLHGRLDVPDFLPVYQAFPTMPLVSISHNQRAPMPRTANWLAKIPHGLPDAVCPFHPDGGDYLAFLGRISPEKRPDRAIMIAKRAGVRLKIAAKVDPVDQDYFNEVVKPLLDDPLIEFIGEIGEREKSDFLGNALALLFPIDWPEPFGLVMIEAMSAGTPVIAWREGSVPEVVDDQVTGVIVASMDEAVQAVTRVRELDRRAVRRRFDARFTASKMAANYLQTYERLLHGDETRLPAYLEGHAGIVPALPGHLDSAELRMSPRPQAGRHSLRQDVRRDAITATPKPPAVEPGLEL
jgi:glycosyltransferase involved in cell wall biosynthesis